MALIKCSECGKEISDKAKACVNCGNPIKIKKEKKVKKCIECGEILDRKDKICKKCGSPITKNKKRIKNMKSIILITIGTLILTALAGAVAVFVNDLELIFFYIGLLLGLYFAIVFLVMYIKRVKNNKKKFNIFIVLSILLMLVFSLCMFVFIQDNTFSTIIDRLEINDNITIHVFYSEEDKNNNALFEYIDNTYPSMFILEKHDVSNEEEKDLMIKVAEYFELNNEEIKKPFIVINANYIEGFNEKAKKKLSKITEQEFNIYSSNELTDEEIAYYNVVNKIKKGKDVLEPQIDKRTPKQKLVDYLIEHEGATYSNDKCNWTFTVYGLNDTFYYTLDFKNKKFIYNNYKDGQSYYEYNYGSDTGYAKSVSTIGWTVTTKVNVTFDSKKETYKYKWTSSMKTIGSVAEIMASQVNDLRNNLRRYCNQLEIEISDL